MAFWGVPVVVADHAQQACRAARAIAAAVKADNALRRGRGESTIKLRMGIHTGRAIVGNIGAPGRINYTLIGDTVNVAQRLQELGKELEVGDEVEVLMLVAASTADNLSDEFRL